MLARPKWNGDVSSTCLRRSFSSPNHECNCRRGAGRDSELMSCVSRASSTYTDPLRSIQNELFTMAAHQEEARAASQQSIQLVEVEYVSGERISPAAKTTSFKERNGKVQETENRSRGAEKGQVAKPKSRSVCRVIAKEEQLQMWGFRFSPCRCLYQSN